MIVIAIIGIFWQPWLYRHIKLTQKARFSEVILATGTVKPQVEVWAQKYGALPLTAQVSTQGGNVGTQVATLAWSGTQITATGGANVDSQTYILTATLTGDDTVTWVEGGSCIAAGLC